MNDLDITFPPNFVWGAATASYQVEGATREDGRGESIWDRFCATSGCVRNGDTGDIAADHYHRYRQDVALMRELGLNAYRFSIAWPRVVPSGTGRVNPKGLDFYDRLVDALLEAGLEPYPTLYHWDLPQALEDEGGWTNPATVHAFLAYVDATVRVLGDRVRFWTTLNEPWCSAWLGYGLGVHAPGHADERAAVVAAHHLLLAHGRAVDLIGRACPRADIGIVLNPSCIYPASKSPEDVEAARLSELMNNRWFLDPIFRGQYPETLTPLHHLLPDRAHDEIADAAAPIAFLGVNYYTRQIVRTAATGRFGMDTVRPRGARYTDMGEQWEIYPEGLTDLLVKLHRDYAPASIYVTENGAAFRDIRSPDGSVHDPARTAYLAQHIQAAARAMDAGVPLRGYFVWSLLDNFEWSEGNRYRFGIVSVDYATQARTIKDSGRWYRELIRRTQNDRALDRALAVTNHE